MLSELVAGYHQAPHHINSEAYRIGLLVQITTRRLYSADSHFTVKAIQHAPEKIKSAFTCQVIRRFHISDHCAPDHVDGILRVCWRGMVCFVISPHDGIADG